MIRASHGRVLVDRRGEALQTAREWRRRDMLWTDGSRLDSGGWERERCASRTPCGWAGRHLGTNKEVSYAEIYAIYRALCGRIRERDSEVTVQWVPAHYGIEGNEKADEFAKATAGESAPPIQPPTQSPMSTSGKLARRT